MVLCKCGLMEKLHTANFVRVEGANGNSKTVCTFPVLNMIYYHWKI